MCGQGANWCATVAAMTPTLGRWQTWAAAYVGLVAITATLNQLSGDDVVGWHVASVALTLPLSVLAIYPIFFLAGAVSLATGGDSVHGNAFGAGAVVAAFTALAVANVVISRAFVRTQRRTSSK